MSNNSFSEPVSPGESSSLRVILETLDIGIMNCSRHMEFGGSEIYTFMCSGDNWNKGLEINREV